MVRAPLAICLPLAGGLVTGHTSVCLPIALGGLVSSVVDRGGPYLGRVRRVATATIGGSAVGLAVGLVLHGRGWATVVVIMLLAVASALVSAVGEVGSVTGLQLLVYAVLGTGPLGMLRPWWAVIGLFLLGAAWGLGLAVLGWVLNPSAPQREAVASVYRSIAHVLRAVGTADFEPSRQAVTDAMNTAYDQVMTAGEQESRLAALLLRADGVIEATLTLEREPKCPDPQLIVVTERIAEVISRPGTGAAPWVPSVSDSARTPGPLALAQALAGVTDLLAGDSAAEPGLDTSAHSLRTRLSELTRVERYGRLARIYTIRLTLCMGVAAVLTEVLDLQRSYWVMLTTAVVLKPDFGSVFARALQRAIGTMVGVVMAAALLAVVPHGPLLIIPLAVCAFLLPYGMSRNYGLFATFLTPLVALLIDLLAPTAGWSLVLTRLLDTLLGCAAVLLVGYAPWPSSWHTPVVPQFADAVHCVAGYLRTASRPDSAERSPARRRAYRALSDLRVLHQRALAEPAPVRRRINRMCPYPAIADLEQILDAATATAVATDRGAPAPTATEVDQLVSALDQIADTIRHGHTIARQQPLPTGPAARPIAQRIRAVTELISADR
jgi:uncharacterized membrane protein YccC